MTAVNHLETPDDLADLVEYMFGDVSTRWGQRRGADGHPQPYPTSPGQYFEIGK